MPATVVFAPVPNATTKTRRLEEEIDLLRVFVFSWLRL
jgi:hypothetical protein